MNNCGRRETKSNMKFDVKLLSGTRNAVLTLDWTYGSGTNKQILSSRLNVE
jgi:hypothetical protein